MTNLQTLIDQTYTYAIEATQAGNYDLAETYWDDRQNFLYVDYLLQKGRPQDRINKYIDNLDTATREQIIEAMIKDQ